MNPVKYETDLKDLLARNRRLVCIIGVQTLTLLLTLFVIGTLAGRERTILVPPAINKTFWVSADHASREYLNEMASFIAWLILDVTPASIDWKKQMLLGYVTPSQYGALKLRQELEGDRLKRLNASTYFLPQQLVSREDQQSVVIHGRLQTQVNGVVTREDTTSWLAEFALEGGRLHLKTFRELPHAKP